eukprot:TRINITY_DN10887_c0_g1_i1.p1 TRINITY_DN10887_c0_g1~~TRINITY_DN10887_c0_g1_i1.p1  ORF type:complete len:441 (-),score=100.63 TRINITY_DN10887_c0_g1_i1:645-1967(-)
MIHFKLMMNSIFLKQVSGKVLSRASLFSQTPARGSQRNDAAPINSKPMTSKGIEQQPHIEGFPGQSVTPPSTSNYDFNDSDENPTPQPVISASKEQSICSGDKEASTTKPVATYSFDDSEDEPNGSYSSQRHPKESEKTAAASTGGYDFGDSSGEESNSGFSSAGKHHAQSMLEGSASAKSPVVPNIAFLATSDQPPRICNFKEGGSASFLANGVEKCTFSIDAPAPASNDFGDSQEEFTSSTTVSSLTFATLTTVVPVPSATYDFGDSDDENVPSRLSETTAQPTNVNGTRTTLTSGSQPASDNVNGTTYPASNGILASKDYDFGDSEDEDDLTSRPSEKTPTTLASEINGTAALSSELQIVLTSKGLDFGDCGGEVLKPCASATPKPKSETNTTLSVVSRQDYLTQSSGGDHVTEDVNVVLSHIQSAHQSSANSSSVI